MHFTFLVTAAVRHKFVIYGCSAYMFGSQMVPVISLMLWKRYNDVNGARACVCVCLYTSKMYTTNNAEHTNDAFSFAQHKMHVI